MCRKDIAFFAGFLQGEACFHIGRRKGFSREFNLAVMVAQKDSSVLKALTNVMGVGRMYYVEENGFKKTPIYRWVVNSKDDVTTVLEQIIPHLMGRARRKAEAVLEMAKTKRVNHAPGIPRGLSKQEIRKRVNIYKEWPEAQELV